jgi:hypothetical protein
MTSLVFPKEMRHIYCFSGQKKKKDVDKKNPLKQNEGSFIKIIFALEN